MASVATGISLEGYLATSYERPTEYIDGELKEKPLTGMRHGEVQAILSGWFRSHRKEWGIAVSVETHTKVKPTHVRLPDVVVVRKGERVRGTLATAPLIAIEVLSPDDSYEDLKDRAADLHTMGTENIWLLDEKRRTAEVWDGRQWRLFEGPRLQAVNAPVFVDLDWLWAEVDDE